MASHLLYARNGETSIQILTSLDMGSRSCTSGYSFTSRSRLVHLKAPNPFVIRKACESLCSSRPMCPHFKMLQFAVPKAFLLRSAYKADVQLNSEYIRHLPFSDLRLI